MREKKAYLFPGFFKTNTPLRVALWLGISLVLTIVFFPNFWANLPQMLSPNWILGQNQASLWGVLALCLIFLWLKRKEVWQRMREGQNNLLILPGLALIAAAVFIPYHSDYLIFQVLLAIVGVFIIFFGRAVRIPVTLLGIYGLAISFPLAIQRFAENAYAQTAIAPLNALLNALSYPLTIQGQNLQLSSFTGENISVIVTAACAGPATMGVFFALFALMSLDRPLPRKKAVWMFVFGVGGTWLQSFFRLLILMLVAYYLGEAAMWTTHFWTIYILFPLWYLLFVYLYFRQGVNGKTSRVSI